MITYIKKHFFFLQMIRCWSLLKLCITLRRGRCHIYWMPQLCLSSLIFFMSDMMRLSTCTYLNFSFSMHKFRGSLNLNGHRETASVIPLQCTHLSLKCVFECVWNLVLIYLHCRRNENIWLAEKNMALLRKYCLQTFLQFCTL